MLLTYFIQNILKMKGLNDLENLVIIINRRLHLLLKKFYEFKFVNLSLVVCLYFNLIYEKIYF